MSQSLEAKIPSESSLVNEELKKNLKMIFERLVRPVCLKAVLDPEQPASVEMGSFLKAVAQLSPWIELQLLERGEDSEADGALDTEHLPSTGLFGENGYLGAAFLGVPGGKEINSFVVAILNAAGPEKELDQKLLKKIAKLKKKNVIRVFVSLSCHHCQSVVTAGQTLALLSPNVECTMVDARLYPDLVEKYKLSRVPAILIGEAMYMGEKSLEELLALLR
ncbi:thioredoxin reductase [Clostridium sp. AM29-11AC]|uniref:thioredoxin family protein n=1 Tax=Clostridium sp. AM29-11AC TaxID=2293028 RepID=UPI000E4FAC8A|nr:thioredoxin family protein [Clostridium sp. AM29-11AC]RHT55330.1 thioredoxin reductase [Clostridium sp. AM29-11AC]